MRGLTQRGHGAAPPSSGQRLPQPRRGSHRGPRPGSHQGLWGGEGVQVSPSTTSPCCAGEPGTLGMLDRLAAAALLPVCVGSGGSAVSAAAGGTLSSFSRLGRLPIPRVRHSAPAAALWGKGRLVPCAGGRLLWQHQPCGTAAWGCGQCAAEKGRGELWAGAGAQPPGGPLRKPPPSLPPPNLRGHLGTCGHSWGKLGALPSPGWGIHSPTEGSARPCSPSECCQPSPVSPGCGVPRPNTPS